MLLPPAPPRRRRSWVPRRLQPFLWVTTGVLFLVAAPVLLSASS